MPPNSTFERLTLGSSVRSGVYSGSSVTSWPRVMSSAASALSRRQLPQYMPPAPAVMERIFMRQGTLRFSHVPLDQAAAGASDRRDRLACCKMDHAVGVHAWTRLSPARSKQMQHTRMIV